MAINQDFEESVIEEVDELKEIYCSVCDGWSPAVI